MKLSRGGGLAGGAAFVATAALLALAVGPELARLNWRDDLLWYLPTVAWIHEQATGPIDLLARLVDPRPREYGVGSLNLYTAAVTALVGQSAGALAWVGMLLHIGTGGLVWRLAWLLGVRAGIASIAGIAFVAAFPVSGAYLWPMAAQHALVVAGILLVLERYLTTERHRARGAAWGTAYWLTLLAALLASGLRASVLIAPVALAGACVLGGSSPRDRRERYERWLPCFLVFCGLPVVSLTAGGEPILRAYLPQFVAGAAGAWLLFLAGIAVLGLVTALLRLLERCPASLSARAGFSVLLVASVAFATVLGNRTSGGLPGMLARLPIPAGVTLAAVLDPVAAALRVDTTNRWDYLLLASPGAVWPWIAVALLAIAAIGCLHRSAVAMLGAWSLMAGAQLATSASALTGPLPANAGWPVAYPERYLLYVLPPVVIAIAAVIDAGLRRWDGARRPWVRAIALALGAMLLVQNVAAVRLGARRSAVPNDLLDFRYLAATGAVAADLAAARAGGDARPIAIDQVPLLPFADIWQRVVSPVDPARLDAFRAALSVQLGPVEASRALLSTSALPDDGRTRLYHLAPWPLLDPSGATLDPFERAFARGVAQFADGNGPEAAASLRIATAERPYLLRHALGALPDEDLRFITGGQAGRPWLRTLIANHTEGASFAAPPGDTGMAELGQWLEDDLAKQAQALILLAFLWRDDPDQTAFWAARAAVLIDEGSIGDPASIPSGLPTGLNGAVAEYLHSDRFRRLAFPRGNAGRRQFMRNVEPVGLTPGDWPWDFMLGRSVQPALSAQPALAPGTFALRDGFYPAETNGSSTAHWTAGRGAIELRAEAGAVGTARVSFTFVQPNPPGNPEAPALAMTDGSGTTLSPVIEAAGRAGHFQATVEVPLVALGGVTRVVLRSPTFVPRQVEPGNSDPRRLGIEVDRVSVFANGRSQRETVLPELPPVSVNLEQRPTADRRGPTRVLPTVR